MFKNSIAEPLPYPTKAGSVQGRGVSCRPGNCFEMRPAHLWLIVGTLLLLSGYGITAALPPEAVRLAFNPLAWFFAALSPKSSAMLHDFHSTIILSGLSLGCSFFGVCAVCIGLIRVVRD